MGKTGCDRLAKKIKYMQPGMFQQISAISAFSNDLAYVGLLAQ